jgi:PAS domain S-box-containing protein
MESALAPEFDDSDEEKLQELSRRVVEAVGSSQGEDEAPIDEEEAGIAVVDGRMRYVEINEKLARINGIPVEEHIGKTIAEVVPTIAPVVEPVMRRILETGKPEFNIEVEGEVASEPGVIRKWTLSFVPLADNEDGKPRGVGALVLDVTNKRNKAGQVMSAPILKWPADENKANSGQPEGGKLNNRIKILKDVSQALSAAAEVLEHARSFDLPHTLNVENGIDFNDEVKRFEINLIRRALKESGGNQKKAARLLNLKHTTLHTKIKRYNVDVTA